MPHYIEHYSEELNKRLRTQHFKPECEFCKHEIIIRKDEFTDVILYEPYEKESERIVFTYDGDYKHRISERRETYKETVSSDPNKDILIFKCPYCGHICNYTREYINSTKCSFYGDNKMRFELSEAESEAARKFMKEHAHTGEFPNGRKFFSTLGMQFTFEITPGGLGNEVTIKCNHCHEQKSITDTDNW